MFLPDRMVYTRLGFEFVRVVGERVKKSLGPFLFLVDVNVYLVNDHKEDHDNCHTCVIEIYKRNRCGFYGELGTGDLLFSSSYLPKLSYSSDKIKIEDVDCVAKIVTEAVLNVLQDSIFKEEQGD